MAGSPAARQPHALVLSAAGALSVAALVVAATVVPPAKVLPPRPPSAVPPEVAAQTDLPLGVVMFGDSVARSLSGAPADLQPWRPEQSTFDPSLVRLWNVARTYCTYLEGSLVMADGGLNTGQMLCGAWRQFLATALEGDDYDVVLVGLANDAGDRVVDGETVELGSARHQALLTSFLDELRGIAAGHGAEVVLLALPPRADTLRSDLDTDGRRERLMREELRRYAADRPGTRILDLFELVCPGGDCEDPPEGFDPAWRPDGWHFSTEGARWVADWLTAQLIDLEPETAAAP